MKRRPFLFAAAATMAAVMAVSSCATILHPERRGNRGGPLSTPDLVMDILWLIPGIIPGIVALAVDFSTGAIYEGGAARRDERTAARASAHVPTLAAAASLELRLVDGGGIVYDRDGATVEAGSLPRVLAVDLDRVALRTGEGLPRDLYLELDAGDGRTARLAVPRAGEWDRK
jgi:hypothetical protein